MYRHARPLPCTRPRSLAGRRSLVGAMVAAAVSLMSSAPARADNLLDLLQSARGYDAAYLAAKAQADSVQYRVEQAYALRRPSVGLQGAITRSHLDSSVPPSTLTTALGQRTNNSNYTSRRVAVQVRQSLYNGQDAAQIEQAERSLDVAVADLETAENDLIVRVTQAYFDVLAAQDVLLTTQANKKALAEQLAAARRSFEVGNATITDTREAQARHDLASAQEIAATNDLQVKRIALDQLVGRPNVQPDPLASPANLESLSPGQVDDWIERSARAPLVRKAELGLEVARLEIDKARAGHLPAVAATASVAQTEVDAASSFVRTSMGAGTSATVGVEVNMPLFAGFATQNRVKEALALQEKSERDLDNARRSVSLATRQAYTGVMSGLAQVKAYEAAESSAKLALEATQLGYRVGVRINKDVLDAQTALANTQKDLYKARYDVIVGSVRLRQAAGTLQPEALADLNRLLAPGGAPATR